MSSLVSVKQKIKTVAMSYYGNLISTDDPVFDENEKVWKARLRSNYPRLIKNDYPEERFIRVLPLKGLGTICLDEELQFVKNCSSTREENVSLVHSYLEMWRDKVEDILVEASSLQLAMTGTARVFLNPAYMILAYFVQNRSSVMSLEQLEKLRNVRIERWLTLLIELKLIKRIDEGYSYGEMFTSIESETHSDNDFITKSMAHILRESYPLLKESFHIQQFEPLVHLDACYYRPAIEAEKVLYQTPNSLFKRFAIEYMYRPDIELGSILLELNNSKALLHKEQYQYANEEIFQNMLSLKRQIPEVALPKA